MWFQKVMNGDFEDDEEEDEEEEDVDRLLRKLQVGYDFSQK